MDDAFVTKLSTSGSALVYSTYLGGSGGEFAAATTVDGSGNVYLAGLTDSNDFPTKNPLQPALDGVVDGFVTKLDTAGSTLAYSTYLGGSGSDGALALAVDGTGSAYVAGRTSSTDFPIKGAFQPALSTGFDAFVTKLGASGSSIDYSTYLGGSGGQDYAFAIAVDGSGNAYVAGQTDSNDFPTLSAFQSKSGGGSDGFVVKMDPMPAMLDGGADAAPDAGDGGSRIDAGSGSRDSGGEDSGAPALPEPQPSGCNCNVERANTPGSDVVMVLACILFVHHRRAREGRATRRRLREACASRRPRLARESPRAPSPA